MAGSPHPTFQSRLDQMEVRDALYELERLRAARPTGPGECDRCLKMVRARFPVIWGCVDRIGVDLCCAPCAMIPPDPNQHLWYCWSPTRAEADEHLRAKVWRYGGTVPK